jgi:hypothetical protein
MSKKAPRADERLPLVFVHAHITVVEPTTLAAAVGLRDAIQAVVQQYAEQHGIRIKRKRVTQRVGRQLWNTYQARAKLFMMIE